MADKTKKQAAEASEVETGYRLLYGTRSDTAVTSATHQLEAIFETLIALVRLEMGDEGIPQWPNFDPSFLPWVIKALAIRGRDLNSAIMGVRVNELSAEALERLVYHG
jgi:hypothetical protein